MKAKAVISYKPIGIIHTGFKDCKDTPIQSALSDADGTVEVFTEYSSGLKDIEGFSHIFLIYHFHQAGACSLVQKPFLDNKKQRGIFAIRHFNRPNPIGLSIVELRGVKGNILEIRGADMLDGTPLLDIKPYIRQFDCRENARSGWVDEQKFEISDVKKYTPGSLQK
ncbi:MAG TPA: tRNA (N6-threonylcarbamoyladenosine(37)-N6)-methyltransferase TrmO [Methanocella sp.]|uniref:tRNA (N6-threonylcarbamoyladenosine(37)-N6)-methyltransferase TrmO n=1 Tax=Methanocella sp. TaxID=2052833 RepID=UPI002C615044|nr:tRNA (N6-threonylcarbamoyladenosine(37)-N6)-methyltransferase TrmO [Methanocella sp.]HTY89599.1 tRNA (N6-threonylcarbamoyladenosine(37)-N6)-methyltransferase TrmO [Methanocella sp.]